MFRLLLFSALGVTLTLPSLAEKPMRWGINGHPLSQESYWQVPLMQQLDLIQEMGLTWYRFDISPASFQANTARLDGLLDEAEKRGLHLLPVLVPTDELKDGQITLEQLREHAAAFAKSIVSRYKGRITHWELANELDGFAMLQKGEKDRTGRLWEWDGDPEGSSVEDYHQGRYERVRSVLQGLQHGVKEADPTAQTLIDTAGWLHYGFMDRLVKEDGVPFDILAWHWYSEMGDLTKAQGRLDLIEKLKSYGKPLWITEINRRDGSKGGREKEMAEYLGGMAQQLSTRPDVEAFFVYELLDEPAFGEGGESDYGVVTVQKRADGAYAVRTRKAGFEVLKGLRK